MHIHSRFQRFVLINVLARRSLFNFAAVVRETQKASYSYQLACQLVNETSFLSTRTSENSSIITRNFFELTLTTLSGNCLGLHRPVYNFAKFLSPQIS
jgi:hypothetical protein